EAARALRQRAGAAGALEPGRGRGAQGRRHLRRRPAAVHRPRRAGRGARPLALWRDRRELRARRPAALRARRVRLRRRGPARGTRAAGSHGAQRGDRRAVRRGRPRPAAAARRALGEGDPGSVPGDRAVGARGARDRPRAPGSHARLTAPRAFRAIGRCRPPEGYEGNEGIVFDTAFRTLRSPVLARGPLWPSPRSAAGGALLVLLLVLAGGPIALVAWASINSAPPGQPGQLTLAAWQEALRTPALFNALVNSVLLGVTRVGIGVVLAVGFVWLPVRPNT